MINEHYKFMKCGVNFQIRHQIRHHQYDTSWNLMDIYGTLLVYLYIVGIQEHMSENKEKAHKKSDL